MTTLVGSEGALVNARGPMQPFPRSSVPLSMYGDGVALIGDGRTVSYADLYRRQLWVAVAVHKLSRQVSRLPLKVYKQTATGRERVRTGKLAELLRRPFDHAGPTHLKQAIMIAALVQGNAALRKSRVTRGPQPVRLEPLAWSSLRIIGEIGGPIEAFESSQPGQPRFIGVEDVVHIAWRGIDGPIGVSPLAQLGVTLGIEDAAQSHQRAMLAQGARPPSAITVDKEFLGWEKTERDKALANLRADVNLLYAGPENAGRPALLPPGLDWKPVGHTAVEAALIDQRKIAREEIAAVYDVSPPLIGMLEKSTFNNITELHRMLYVTVLGPWLNLIEETLQAQLIDAEAIASNQWVEFDLSEVLKGDLLQRSQALALQIASGVLTIDEAREIENRATFGLPETSKPLYAANNLRPVGTFVTPDDNKVQQAALAVAAMEPLDVCRLLAQTGGSMVDAILAQATPQLPLPEPNGAGTNGNGAH